MNTAFPSLLVIPLFCGLLIPAGVLVWYMHWRQKERSEIARQIESMIAGLSRAEAMIGRLKITQPQSDREGEIPVVHERSYRTAQQSLLEQDPMMTRQRHGILNSPPHSVTSHSESGRETPPGSIEKAKVLLKGGIPPVEVARTLNIGLGEVEMLHRMIAMVEQREAVTT